MTSERLMVADNEKNIMSAISAQPRVWRQRGGGWAMLVFAVLAGVLLGGGGIIAGMAHRMTARMERNNGVEQVRDSVLPEDVLTALGGLENRTGDLPTERLDLALAYAIAARRLPEQEMYRQKSLRELEFVLAQADFSPPGGKNNAFDWRRWNGERFKPSAKTELQLLRAGTLAELSRPAEALTVAEDALKTLPLAELTENDNTALRARGLNLQAYILATAEEVANPERALELANEVMRLPGAASNSAFLDTYAMALLANSRPAEAWAAQRRAWGLAGGDSLWEYQENFQKIADALAVARNDAPPPGGMKKTRTSHEHSKEEKKK